LILLALLAIYLSVRVVLDWHQTAEHKKDETDAGALRSVIAEAYININEDPDFVNTATEDAPMEVPEKYYTYVESVQGDGRVYVFVRYDGSVEAYFGTPEKTRGYYSPLID